MGLERTEPQTEAHGGFTVAGVAHRGTDFDQAALWRSLDDYADDLDDVTVGNARYGVLFDLDENSGEFTYVAGVEVESNPDLPPELTVVEIPEATYAVYAATADTVAEVVAEMRDGHVGESDRDTVPGPLFERYDPDENPADPHAPLEFCVPVHAE